MELSKLFTSCSSHPVSFIIFYTSFKTCNRKLYPNKNLFFFEILLLVQRYIFYKLLKDYHEELCSLYSYYRFYASLSSIYMNLLGLLTLNDKLSFIPIIFYKFIKFGPRNFNGLLFAPCIII